LTFSFNTGVKAGGFASHSSETENSKNQHETAFTGSKEMLFFSIPYVNISFKNNIIFFKILKYFLSYVFREIIESTPVDYKKHYGTISFKIEIFFSNP
jgi:hypothetical protein